MTRTTRPHYVRSGRRHASDLTDAEWALIEPHLPLPKRLVENLTRDTVTMTEVATDERHTWLAVHRALVRARSSD